MPPKRKRAEDAPVTEATSSTRATRSSARQSAGSSKDDSPVDSKPAPVKKTTTKAPKATAKSSEAPAAKKAKTTAAKASTSTAKATVKKAAPKKSKKIIDISSEGESDSFPADDEPAPSTSKSIPTPPVSRLPSPGVSKSSFCLDFYPPADSSTHSSVET
ncbi:hypothetical protein C8R46DRAFT_458173 [Mycena filopes]|nr:hypothetical protein C8R46DRAFT_458173 [Mycena filopes]